MASLDLVPDLSIFLAQSALFATSYVVVQRFVVTPYLQLRKLREDQTLKQQKEAAKREKLASEKLKHLEEQLAINRKELRESEEQQLKKIHEKSRDDLEGAKLKTKGALESNQVKVNQELMREKETIKTNAKTLADSFFEKLTHM